MEKTGLFRQIDQFLMRTSAREKWMLGGGSIVALLLIAYFSLLDPTLQRMTQLEGLIPRKERAMHDLLQLKDLYQTASNDIKILEKRLPKEGTFSPLSFLEENAAKNKIRNNIAFIRPLTPQTHKSYREVPVEVKVENVTLSQIIPFLTALENGPHRLRIKRLSMKTRFSNPDLMDVTFLALSYEKGTP